MTTATQQGGATFSKKVARVFGLKGEAWLRHANAASVWTRFAALPLLVVSIWSRDWIGWLSLVPIALSLAWMFVNPMFFKPPSSTKNWASGGVFDERIWAERDRSDLPERFRSVVPTVISVYQAIGMAPLAYGLITLEFVPEWIEKNVVTGRGESQRWAGDSRSSSHRAPSRTTVGGRP